MYFERKILRDRSSLFANIAFVSIALSAKAVVIEIDSYSLGEYLREL